MKATACQEDSTLVAKYFVFTCVHVHVGVSTFACGMWNPEGNVKFPQSLSILFTEAGPQSLWIQVT